MGLWPLIVARVKGLIYIYNDGGYINIHAWFAVNIKLDFSCLLMQTNPTDINWFVKKKEERRETVCSQRV
jgi:ribosomal protein L24E